MAQAARLAARLQRELTMLHSDPPPGVSAWPCHDHLLTHLQAQIHGPQGTVYSNGIFKLDIQVPERYPFEPPNIKFVTPVYHPNIDNGGRICLDILNLPPKGAWRPSLNLPTVLASIGLLLAEPNPDDGLMGEITAEYKHDRLSFDCKARKWTKLYAGQDQVTTEVNEANTSSYPQTSQTLAPVGFNSQGTLQVAPSRGPQDIIPKCDPPSQPFKSGLSFSKRLALDRGLTCSQQDNTISHINSNKFEHAAAKAIVSPLESGDNSLQAKSCSSKETLGREEQFKGNVAPESQNVTNLGDKNKFFFQVDNEEGNSCTDSIKGLFHGMVGEKPKTIIHASNSKEKLAERSAEVSKVPQVHECCSPSISISSKMQSKDVSEGPETKISRPKAEDWKDIACAGKENQPPKPCPARKPSIVIPSQLAEKKEMVEIKPTDASVGIHCTTTLNNTISEPVKEKGLFSLPSRTKSLKLARTKLDTPSFHSITSQQMLQSIPVEKKRANSPKVIPDDIPIVVVSDSGSDSELSDEGFTFSLTQRCLSNKRKAGSKLR